MKNKLEDLNNHLFAQIERLSDEDLTGEKLTQEVARTKAITSVASNIISNAGLVLDAHKALGDNLVNQVPAMMLENKQS